MVALDMQTLTTLPESEYRNGLAEVVKYASKRFVTVVPEIDLPGHTIAALTAYPHLGCVGEGYKVREIWGIAKEVMCLGKESTFEFIENVLGEVLELFPSKYIHIGGDECPRDAWKVCPLCQARIKAETVDVKAFPPNMFPNLMLRTCVSLFKEYVPLKVLPNTLAEKLLFALKVNEY